MPPEQHDKLAYAQLKSSALEFSATDWLHATRTPRQGNTVAMYITGDTSELRAIVGKLSAGADPDLLDELRDGLPERESQPRRSCQPRACRHWLSVRWRPISRHPGRAWESQAQKADQTCLQASSGAATVTVIRWTLHHRSSVGREGAMAFIGFLGRRFRAAQSSGRPARLRGRSRAGGEVPGAGCPTNAAASCTVRHRSVAVYRGVVLLQGRARALERSG